MKKSETNSPKRGWKLSSAIVPIVGIVVLTVVGILVFFNRQTAQEIELRKNDLQEVSLEVKLLQNIRQLKQALSDDNPTEARRLLTELKELRKRLPPEAEDLNQAIRKLEDAFERNTILAEKLKKMTKEVESHQKEAENLKRQWKELRRDGR